MKILLTTLNAKYIHSNLALKYLYNVVAEAYCDVEVMEFTINNDENYIFSELVRGKYDIVCFSCYIWNIEKTLTICENFKKACPNIKLLLGGPEVSYDYLDFIKEHKFIDFIIRGEGEYPFYQFCRTILNGQMAFETIPGLAYRQDGRIYVNGEGEPIDFNSVPFPYKNAECDESKIVYYESSRGCPFRCSYCLSSIDKSIRALPEDRVRSDLGYFLYKNVKQVKFIDRTFNYDKERAYNIFKFLIENDNGTTNFHMELCGNLLNDRTLELLKKARKNLFQFEIGIQSTNPISLAAVDRDDNVYPTLYFVEKIIAMGNIHVHVDLIAGLPYEDLQSFKKSFNKVYELHAQNLQLGFLKLLKGTKIREESEKYGYIFRDKAPYEVISNHFISAEELVSLKMIEQVLELFHNRGGFERTQRWLMKELNLNAFEFYERFADFYYSMGYHHASHKKEALYHIILQFAETLAQDKPDLMNLAKSQVLADMNKTLNDGAIKRYKARL